MADDAVIRTGFALTLEDFAEAQRAHAGNRPWLLWPFFGLMAIYPLFLNVMYAGTPQSSAPVEATWFNFLKPFIPILVFLPVATFILWKVSRQSGQPWSRGVGRIVSVNASRHARLTTLGVLTVVGVLLIGYRIRLALDQTPVDPLEVPAVTAVFEMLPSLLVTGFGLLTAFISFGDRYARPWQLQTSLHRPFMSTISEDLFTIAEPLTETHHAWASFAGYLETPRLFLLYVSAMGFHIIPKRALAAPGELELFRDRCVRLIAGRPQPGQPMLAIPVTPPVPPTPTVAPVNGPPPIPQVRA